MKMMNKLLLMGMLAMATLGTQANPFMNEAKKDTVIIELENGSRIIIYTKNKEELKRLLAYDVNEMIKDLNKSVQKADVDRMEIQNTEGKNYMIESPTVLFGSGISEGDTVYVDKRALDNIRIRVGGLELFMDPDEFDEYDDWGDDDDDVITRYSYVDNDRSRTRNYFNVDVGTNNWLEGNTLPSASDADYAVRPWGSWYLGANFLNRTWVGGPIYLEWGGGVNWYNWKLENSDIRIEKGDNSIEFNSVNPETAGLKSKISATYVNLSVVPMLDFGKGARRVKTTMGDGFKFSSSRRNGFRIGAGVYAGYRMGSTAKYVFKESGDTDRIKERDHFYLSNFRYGIRGQVGFQSFDMFILYDLNEVFEEGRGPGGAQLNAFTIGITL